MRIVPYVDEYKDGVLACLKRNMKWMNKLDNKQLYKWLSPIINYPWINQIDLKKYPYKHGIVLLDNAENVKGFSAVIHSIQMINGNKRMVINPSTTVIDQGYRFYFFNMTAEIIKCGDIVYDLSPNEHVRQASKNLFGFTIISNPSFLLCPVFAPSKKFILETIQNDSILENHGDCGIKCVRIHNTGEETYIYYKIIKRIKKLPIRTVCVLYISNAGFFVDNFRICVSLLSRNECSCVLADSRYINENLLPKIYVKKQKYRAILNPFGGLDYTFLYSELAPLQNEMI